MLKALADTYRTTATFARACPWLFLVPVLPEIAQHVVEYRLGMFASLAGAKAAEHDGLRMAFGSIKILVLLLPGYWVVRFAWWGDDTRAAAWDAAGLRGYGPIFLYGSVVNLAALWLPMLIGGRAGNAITGMALPVLLVLNTLFSRWLARAPLGDSGVGPLRSVRIVAPIILWALAFALLAMLPPMIVHYALNYLSLGKPLPVTTAVLALDALFVGYLTAIICAVPVAITRHAEARIERRRRRS